jgi:signal transduction histidine kinase
MPTEHEVPQSTEATRQPSPPVRGRVWVVDDSPLQIEACRRALDRQFHVATFSNGGAALEAFGAGVVPDVMVLDWHMPDISGIDVCRFVRNHYTLARLPVLILTASGSNDHLLEALSAGANDFVRKPISDLEVSARVAGLVRMAAMYADLLAAQQKLTVEAEFRERFMGMLAHDLRQPLNTMSLAGQALGVPEGASGYVPGAMGMHTRAAQRMKRMIEELLDFTRSRPETGMPIHRQQTDLGQIAQATADEMQSAWPRHTINVHADRHCTGLWDPDRMAQICTNLISNALEHSVPNSAIDVRVSELPGGAQLTVSNSSAVIPPDVLATLFQPFRRGVGLNPSSQGVGLGLYIVDQIVRAHGGTVGAVSSDGRTTFTVSLAR